MLMYLDIIHSCENATPEKQTPRVIVLLATDSSRAYSRTITTGTSLSLRAKLWKHGKINTEIRL